MLDLKFLEWPSL